MGRPESVRDGLLYNSLIDTWRALCAEHGWNWSDAEAYVTFEDFVVKSGLWHQSANVCPLDEEEGAEFLGQYEEITQRPLRTINVRLDDDTLEVIRRFSL